MSLLIQIAAILLRFYNKLATSHFIALGIWPWKALLELNSELNINIGNSTIGIPQV